MTAHKTPNLKIITIRVKDLNQTQVDCAGALGISRSHLCKVEGGGRYDTLMMRLALQAIALGYSDYGILGPK